MKKDKIFKLLYKALFIIIALFWLLFGVLYFKSCIERAYLYPLKYKELVFEIAEKHQLDKRLVFSIIKIESGFDNTAKSSKGALGLMQMTTDTANYVAEITGKKEFDLFNPADSIELGCFYLKYLLSKFKVTETAVVAYNAGEGNVSNWLDDERYSKDSLSLYYIPFKESREYVLKFKKSFEKYTKLYPYILDK